MRIQRIGMIVAVVAMAVFPSLACSQTAPQSGAAKAPPNLAGLWRYRALNASFDLGPRPANAANTTADPYQVATWGFLPIGPDGRPQEPPLQAWAREKYQVVRKNAATLAHRGVEEFDPGMYCIPEGFPRVYTHPDPFEIVHAADRVIMIFPTYYQARQIYLDGRKHPDFGSTYMGHAIGKWDGDTLVTDTVGLKGGELTWLDTLGTPHTDALRVIERIKRPRQEILEIDFTFEDPKAFTRPWEGKKRFYLMPASWESMEFVLCDVPKGLGGTGEYSK